MRRTRSCVAGSKVTALATGFVLLVKLSAWPCNVRETISDVVTIRRDALVALETNDDFLYEGCTSFSMYSCEMGWTEMFWLPSWGKEISTGSVQHYQ